MVGDAATVADELQGWMDDTGIDGFNLSRIVMPESYEDFVDIVVPELQNRGIYKTEGRARTTDLLDAGDTAICALTSGWRRRRSASGKAQIFRKASKSPGKTREDYLKTGTHIGGTIRRNN